jgi:thymidylate kinase
MEKLIIIEGTDRTGKDTLVNRLVESAEHAVKRHFTFPEGKTDEDKKFFQQLVFNREFRIWKIVDREMRNTLMVWNRSYIGEAVYGTIYRNSSPHEWLWDLEKHWEMHIDPRVYLVVLYADPEFLVAKEDGKSYSNSLQDKTREVEAFLEAFHKTAIQRKLLIKVNDGGEYIDREDIFNQVISFVNDQES